MKWIKDMKTVLAVCVAVTGLAQAAVVEKPMVLPDAMAVMTISDLHGFIDGVGSVAAQVSPMMSGMMIKNMLGMQLGDPGLAGIAPGKGMAIVVLDQTNAFAVIEVGEAQVAVYTTALSARHVQFKYLDGVLVLGQRPGSVATGVGLVPAVKEKLLAKRSPTLRITLQPAALIAKNEAQIQGLLQMMPMMMGRNMMQSPGMDPAAMQGTIRVLEGEIRVLLSLAKQCVAAGIVVAPSDGSLGISETFVPLMGTRLSTLLTAPKAGTSNPKIQSGLFGDAAISIDATMSNPEAVTEFFAAETEQLIKDMNLQDLNVTGIVDCLKKWMDLYSGDFCEAVDFGGEKGLGVNYALEIKDEATALGLLKSMKDDVAPFLKMYENMGISMSLEFKENVREYKGIKIHQFKTVMAFNDMPEEQSKQLGAMNLTNMVYDVAITDGVMLYAMGGTRIETIIDHLQDDAFKPIPLKARGVYPAGGFSYCDIDVGKYLAFVASVMPKDPNNPMPQVVAMLQGADPITSAGFREDGAVMWGMNIPGSLIGKIGQAAMMMQMQQMQQQMQQPPQAMPPPQSMDPVGVPGSMPDGQAPAPTPAPAP